MNRTIFRSVGIILSIAVFVSCNNNGDKMAPRLKDTTLAEDKKPDPAPEKTVEANKTDYNYEPDVSTVSGTLGVESFYGPPGYGETPKTDSKEDAYILTFDQPINVNSKDTDPYATNVTKQGVTRVQLLSNDGPNLADFKGKKVKVTGTFFGAETGHHHTEVMMDVQKME